MKVPIPVSPLQLTAGHGDMGLRFSPDMLLRYQLLLGQQPPTPTTPLGSSSTDIRAHMPSQLSKFYTCLYQ